MRQRFAESLLLNAAIDHFGNLWEQFAIEVPAHLRTASQGTAKSGIARPMPPCIVPFSSGCGSPACENLPKSLFSDTH
jgi:hypothetical protein